MVWSVTHGNPAAKGNCSEVKLKRKGREQKSLTSLTDGLRLFQYLAGNQNKLSQCMIKARIFISA